MSTPSTHVRRLRAEPTERDEATPLRILFVLNAPWDRRLGGPRVHVELAEQFSQLGHRVDSYSWNDAYPREPIFPRIADFTRSFPRKAAQWIRRNADRYDIIDARAGSLVEPKGRLGFSGLLVVRSTGLLPIYEREFLAMDRSSPEGASHPGTRLARRFQRTLNERRHRLGFRHCDLLNVLNADEERYAWEKLGMEAKTVKLLHGLTDERFSAFCAARRYPGSRRRAPVISFVGAWSRRKGSADVARIVAAIRAKAPSAIVRFLGTGVPARVVIDDCGGDPDGIEVVPKFESAELPDLLGSASVGILPSYVEGFPFSVIEMLAAGVPVVAYDAPGAREIVPLVDPSLLVPRGDATALGRRVVEVLTRPGELERLSKSATRVADSLRWEDIAAETLRIYREQLLSLRASGPAC